MTTNGVRFSNGRGARVFLCADAVDMAGPREPCENCGMPLTRITTPDWVDNDIYAITDSSVAYKNPRHGQWLFLEEHTASWCRLRRATG